jgi:hypothetical protein
MNTDQEQQESSDLSSLSNHTEQHEKAVVALSELQEKYQAEKDKDGETKFILSACLLFVTAPYLLKDIHWLFTALFCFVSLVVLVCLAERWGVNQVMTLIDRIEINFQKWLDSRNKKKVLPP